jgi:multidrug efflux pump subunit AcrA (membrane-fusion protein)
VVLVALGGGALFHYRSEPESGAEAAVQKGPRAVPVDVVPVREETLRRRIEAVGTTLARQAVDIEPQTTGRVASIEFVPGQRVAAGDVLVRLDDEIQQAEVAEALKRLDRPDIAYVSLDVDPNERAADLAEYADRSGYDWSFAIATADVARSLASTFGDQVLSPPSTPLIVIAPSGEVVDHHFGIRNAGQLVEQFGAHLP